MIPMMKTPVSTDTLFNSAMDIVDNRDMYTGFLKKNFGNDWNSVDIGEVHRKLLENMQKYAAGQ